MNLKVLFIDTNLKYLNPTRTLIPIMITNAVAEIDFFGQGYVNSDQLKKGLTQFIKGKSYDALIVTEHIAFVEEDIKETIISTYEKNYYFNFEIKEIESRIDILKDIRTINLPKILLLMESDFYNFTANQIKILDNDYDLILACFGNTRHPGYFKNKYTLPEKFYNFITPFWPEYIRNNVNKVIWFPHFIGENEFNFSNIKRNKYSVPGASYYSREIFISEIYDLNKTLINKYSFIKKLKNFCLSKICPKNHYINYMQENFKIEIENSKAAFTCGSRLGNPIRKFFEIPAHGTALICDPFFGYEKLGFKENENFIKWLPGDDIEIINEKISNNYFISKITKEGRNLILKKHTTRKRSEQLNLILNVFLKSKSVESIDWEDGDIINK